MSNTSNTYQSIGEIAHRWNIHRATVPRIMARFGFSGIKFGASQQASRRYSDKDILAVEYLAQLREIKSQRINEVCANEIDQVATNDLPEDEATQIQAV